MQQEMQQEQRPRPRPRKRFRPSRMAQRQQEGQAPDQRVAGDVTQRVAVPGTFTDDMVFVGTPRLRVPVGFYVPKGGARHCYVIDSDRTFRPVGVANSLSDVFRLIVTPANVAEAGKRQRAGQRARTG